MNVTVTINDQATREIRAFCEKMDQLIPQLISTKTSYDGLLLVIELKPSLLFNELDEFVTKLVESSIEHQ